VLPASVILLAYVASHTCTVTILSTTSNLSSPTGGQGAMEISNLIPHIEALIFASDKPLTSIDLTDLINNAFGFMEDKVTLDQVEASLEGIVEKYNSEFYPFEVRQSGGGWQFLTKKDFHKTIAQLNGEKFLKRLSAAALETLAIIAYKQPITKGEIETIRGVSTDYTIQKLLEKELIIISGRNEQLPGHPLVYATSKTFMDYFGVNSADDLPKIKEVLANQIMEGTTINHTEFDEASTLAVTDDGELIDEANAEEGKLNGFHNAPDNKPHEKTDDIVSSEELDENTTEQTSTYTPAIDETSALDEEDVENSGFTANDPEEDNADSSDEKENEGTDSDDPADEESPSSNELQ
jgi:segregation and condensation protein B